MAEFVRLKQLTSTPGNPGLLPISPATVWRWSKAGTFPKPIRLTAGITVWRWAEVEAFMVARSAAGGAQ